MRPHEEQQCGNCASFVGDRDGSKGVSEGQCARRRLAVVMGNGSNQTIVGTFPLTGSDLWCLEWEDYQTHPLLRE